MEKYVETTLKFTVDEINEIIAKHIGQKNVNVRYVIEEVGADPFDCYRGSDEVVRVIVTY